MEVEVCCTCCALLSLPGHRFAHSVLRWFALLFAPQAAKAAAARAESDRADAAAGRIGTKEPVNLWYERALYEAFLAVPGMPPPDPRGGGVDPRGYVLQRLQQWTAGACVLLLQRRGLLILCGCCVQLSSPQLLPVYPPCCRLVP